MKYALETALRPYDLTPAQWSVLARLSYKDSQTISEIGSSLYFDRPTMSGIIRRLVEKKLVRKQKDVRDQRISRLLITDLGKQVFAELPPIAQAINERALCSFSKNEADLLKEYLRVVLKNMSK